MQVNRSIFRKLNITNISENCYLRKLKNWKCQEPIWFSIKKYKDVTLFYVC